MDLVFATYQYYYVRKHWSINQTILKSFNIFHIYSSSMNLAGGELFGMITISRICVLWHQYSTFNAIDRSHSDAHVHTFHGVFVRVLYQLCWYYYFFQFAHILPVLKGNRMHSVNMKCALTSHRYCNACCEVVTDISFFLLLFFFLIKKSRIFFVVPQKKNYNLWNSHWMQSLTAFKSVSCRRVRVSINL